MQTVSVYKKGCLLAIHHMLQIGYLAGRTVKHMHIKSNYSNFVFTTELVA